MPLTRRLTARRVQFITGHDVSGRLPSDIDLDALADPGTTTAVFMGKRTFPALVDALMARGLPPETPALLAEAISRADQRLRRSTIAELAAQLREDPGDKPAIILFGPLADTSE
jgi:uroporphyrin-III C-methyltransferase